MRKVLFVIVAVLMILAAVGCYSLEEYLTPGTLNRKAVSLVTEVGVADANEFTGYANLAKVRKLKAYVQAAYDLDMLLLDQLREKKQLTYDQLREVVNRDEKISAQKGESLFGPTGLLTLIAGATGMGGLGGIIGLMRKRPGDITKEEYQTALADAGVQTNEKQGQMLELIVGIQEFIDQNQITAESGGKADNATALALKTCLSKATSPATRRVVADAKS